MVTGEFEKKKVLEVNFIKEKYEFLFLTPFYSQMFFFQIKRNQILNQILKDEIKMVHSVSFRVIQIFFLEIFKLNQYL